MLLTQGQNALSSEKLQHRPQRRHRAARGAGADDLRAAAKPAAGTPTAGRAAAVTSRPELRVTEGGAGLVVRNLAKSYAAGRCCATCRSPLRRGEVAALLGPNGAGKTTCFYAIAGLVPPDRGTITVDGQDVTWLPMYRRAKLGIGYLPQEASIFRGMTVADNIRAILEITVPDPEKRHEMLDELLGEFSITHLRRAPGDRAVGRRAAAGGDRALPRGAAELRAARRALRRRRPAGGGRHPHAGAPAEGPRASAC